MKLEIPEMTCGHCKAAVEKAVTGIDPAATVAVDLDQRSAEIDSTADTVALLAALKEAGYEARVAG